MKTIMLSDACLASYKRTARFGVQPEELVRVSVEELFARYDDPFQRAVNGVLKKNAEPYRRLA